MSNGRFWLDEIVDFVTCPVCKPGGMLSSATHTYDEGCLEYLEVLRIVRKGYK